jgi:hypothetical protein
LETEIPVKIEVLAEHLLAVHAGEVIEWGAFGTELAPRLKTAIQCMPEKFIAGLSSARRTGSL